MDGIVRLVTLDGRVAMEEVLVAQGRMALNVAHLPAGVYLLSVQHEAGKSSSRSPSPRADLLHQRTGVV